MGLAAPRHQESYLPGSGIKPMPPALAGGFLSATRDAQEGLARDLACVVTTW